MLSLADKLTTLTSYVLAALAAAEVARGWWRGRDRFRASLLVNVGVLVAFLVGQHQLDAGAAPPRLVLSTFNVVFLLQPLLLLLLVQRFRPVPRWHPLVAAVAVGAGAAAPFLIAGPTATLACSLYMTGAMALIAMWFDDEARRGAGAGTVRLQSAAVGAWLHAGIAGALAIAIVTPDAAPLASVARKLLSVAVFGCYYIAFIGPRFLTSLWTERELYRYLQVITDRPSDERAREAASDLARAASRTVPCTAAAVLLFDEQTLVSYTVAASPLRNLHVEFSSGLVTDAIRRGVILEGRVADCEAPLAAAAAGLGETVIAAPIASTGLAWGALLIVQRTGSLFPDIDNGVLTELCRHTASSLADARLVTMEFDRLRRDASAARHESAVQRESASNESGGRSEAQESRPSRSPFDTERRERILAVEDEEGVRDFLRAILAREGFQVTLAAGCEEAMAAAADTSFDLIVTDVNMPDGTGPELVKALRRRQPYLPAVFISGISRDEFAAMAPGEDRNFLQKPFEGARLVGRIEALLQR